MDAVRVLLCAVCEDSVYVFFFQAEDGIRDLTVTGVQTCALPIYSEFRRTPKSGNKGYRSRDSAGRPARPSQHPGEERRLLHSGRALSHGGIGPQDRKSVV